MSVVFQERLRTAMCRLGIACLFVLIGCALPPPEREEQQFVSDRELDIVALTREGLFFFQRSRFIDAEFKFRQALYIAPEADNIWLNLAVTLKNQGQFDEAEEIYSKLLEKKPESPELLSGLAHVHFAKEDYVEAARFFKLAYDAGLKRTDIVPSAKAARSLAVLYFKLGLEEDALCASALSAALNNEELEVFRHSKLLNALGFPTEAKAYVSEFLNRVKVKQSVELLYELGLSSFALGEIKEAAEILDFVGSLAKPSRGIDADIALVRLIATELVTEQERKEQAEAAAKEASAESREENSDQAEETGESSDGVVRSSVTVGGQDANIQAPAELAEPLASDVQVEEEEDDDEENPMDSIYNGRPLESIAALYWPQNLIEIIQERYPTPLDEEDE